MNSKVKKIVFLVSGNGGSLKFLNEAIRQNSLPLQIVAAIADRECGAVEYARKEHMPVTVIKYSRNQPAELQNELSKYSPDIIITNIHKIIDTHTLSLFCGRFINLHYSLLPAFSGLIGMETVAQAHQRNVRFIGATCHMVTEGVDEGSILTQGCFSVDWSENWDTIIYTVFKTACLCLLSGIFQLINEDQLLPLKIMTINSHNVMFSPSIDFDNILK